MSLPNEVPQSGFEASKAEEERTLTEKATEALSTVSEKATEALSAVGERAKDAFNNASTMATDALSNAGTMATGALSNAGTMATGALGSATGALGSVGERAKDAFSTASEKAHEIVETIQTKITGHEPEHTEQTDDFNREIAEQKQRLDQHILEVNASNTRPTYAEAVSCHNTAGGYVDCAVENKLHQHSQQPIM